MSQDQSAQLPWDAPGWLEQATAWIEAQLGAQGYRIAGAIETIHQRAWSTFARVATDKGVVYFKAPAPAFGYEAGVTQFLTRLRPDCSVPLLAVDLERGWLLTADAGVTLRAASPGVEQIEHWVKVLPLYVDLQIDMTAHAPELLALGMYDRRPALLPDQYAALLEEAHSLRVGLEPGLTPDEHRRLLALRPQVAAWCEELAAYGVPETLMHEEVHDANVLVGGQGYIFTDWSDSSIGHPFFSMLVILRAAAYRLKLPANGPEMRRLQDAYLEPWTKYAGRAELLAALRLAYRLAMIIRALAWHHGTAALPEQYSEPYADYVPGWLQDFLNYDGSETL
jgi:hypothetical protein